MRIDPVALEQYGALLLNYNHLYYFHVTALEGSIKAAADRLGVTQPTVSEQLRSLERSLGVELFERTPTGLKLTVAGREASEHAASMFLSGERLVEALGKTVDEPDVLLRVGASASLARTIAADFLTPVLMVEGCRPSIRTGDFTEMLRQLRSRELDLVIGETEPAELARSGLSVELICRPSLVAVALPDVVAEGDWASLSLLGYRSSSAYRWEVEKHLHLHGLRPKVVGELDDAFLMLEAVLRGDFIAFVPRSVARSALRENKVKVLATITPEAIGVFAVYPGGEGLELARTAVARLIDAAHTTADAP